MSDDAQHAALLRRIKYDPTINAGHVLTFVAMLLTVLVWGMRLEGRVDKIEAATTLRGEQYRADQERVRESMTELKGMGRRIEDKVDTLRLQTLKQPVQ